MKAAGLCRAKSLKKISKAWNSDIYFFGYGPDIPALLRDYTRIAGEIPMIPRYILGNWWSRYWAYTQDELQSLMQEFRAHDIPLSVCIVDMDWHITKTGNESKAGRVTPGTANFSLTRKDSSRGCIRRDCALRSTCIQPRECIRTRNNMKTWQSGWGWIRRLKSPFPSTSPTRDLWKATLRSSSSLRVPSPSRRGIRGEGGVDFWWMDWQQGKKSRRQGA